MRTMMLCVLFSILNTFYGYGQQNTLTERLLHPIEQFETITPNNQAFISSAYFVQTDYILQLPNRWEAACNKSKPLLRILLLSVIQAASFKTESKSLTCS